MEQRTRTTSIFMWCWRFGLCFCVTQKWENFRRWFVHLKIVCTFTRTHTLSCMHVCCLLFVCVYMAFMRILHVPSFDIFSRKIKTKTTPTLLSQNCCCCCCSRLHSNFFLNHKFSFVSFILDFICFRWLLLLLLLLFLLSKMKLKIKCNVLGECKI